MMRFPDKVSIMVSKLGANRLGVESSYAAITAPYAAVRCTSAAWPHRGRMNQEQLPDILDKHQLATLLQVSVRTVEGWRTNGVPGTDPQRHVLAGRNIGGTIRYSKQAILNYLSAPEPHDK